MRATVASAETPGIFSGGSALVRAFRGRAWACLDQRSALEFRELVGFSSPSSSWMASSWFCRKYRRWVSSILSRTRSRTRELIELNDVRLATQVRAEVLEAVEGIERFEQLLASGGCR